ncbi:ZP domain-containing protein-like, partial [Oculina patagonica]
MDHFGDVFEVYIVRVSMAVSNWLSPVLLMGFPALMLGRTSQGVCPNNWIYLQGSCYRSFLHNFTWNQAKLNCEARGSNLVVINSQAEQQAIGENFNFSSSIHIGLYRDPQDFSRWLWVDGSRPSYTNWDQGEPSNTGVWGGTAGTMYHSPPYAWAVAQRYFQPSICETDFIDECAVSNGGNCSHKCVNTAEGYKCECPDPGLVLSMDNKTCQASGVDVQCNSDNMTIVISKSLLRGIDGEHLRLLDTTCKAEETSAHFSLTTPLTGCNTTRRHSPTAVVYSNTVLEISVSGNVTRVREIEIQFSCSYSKYGVVSSFAWEASNRKLVISDEGKGNFTLSLNMFPNESFLNSYTMNDFPVAVELRALLFIEVSVTSSDKQLSIVADRCYATPTRDRKNPLKYEFITKRCPSDLTVEYHSAPSVSAQRFSLEAFRFISDHPFVFVHCHVIVCNATDPDSQCVKNCQSSGLARRSVDDHVNDVYSLVQGPLYLVQEK